LRVQGHSRSSTLTAIKSLSPVLLMISSMSVPIAGLLELKGSGLEVLKSTLNADNFICRLSWSISSHFVAIQS